MSAGHAFSERAAIEAAELAETETAYRAGYEAALGDREADADAWWREHGHALIDGPTHAELEARRWGPGGREHFADPRRDFPRRGRQTQQSQAEPEAEIEAAL